MSYKTFQGDVDIRQVDAIPKSARKLDTKTVMYGEKTGHHHTFSGQVLVYEPTKDDTIDVRGESIQIQKYVDVLEPSTITHQEHATQKIQKGKYVILQEREWNVLEKQLRRVVD